MAAIRGLDVKIAFIFPPQVNHNELQAFFTRPGVSNLKIVEGSLVRGKFVPLVRQQSTTLRRSSRIAALPQQEARHNWIVAATIHYPRPLVDIQIEIEKVFGKHTVKTKNFTDYEAIMPNIAAIQVDAPPVAAMNEDDEMAGLADLFGRGGIGGARRRRRTTRKRRVSRKTRKSKRRSTH
jgi:hypothetical protein